MLSGQEQYYWERAGYFVRRRALSADALAREITTEAQGRALRVMAAAGVRETARALLGEVVAVAPADGLTAGAGWRRGLEPPTDLTATAEMAWLARQPEQLWARVALEADETLRVLPGAHAELLPDAVRAAIADDPAGELEGAVRVRLAPGDAVFLSPRLLYRLEGPRPSPATVELRLVDGRAALRNKENDS